MANSKYFVLPTDQGVAMATVNVDPTTGDPASGGGGGGDTSNIALAGGATPGKTASVGGTDGTNLRVVSTDTAGKLNVNAQPAGNVSTAEAQVALTANTSAPIVASNTNRLFLTIDNPNATDIWINTQGAAVATAGQSMRIFGNTQVTFSVQEIGTNAVTAISVTTVNIRYRETSKS